MKPKQPSIDPHHKFLVIRLPDGAMLSFHTKDPSLVGLLSTMKKEALRKSSIDPKAFEAFMKELGWWNWDTKEVRKELRGALKVYLKEAK